jgi:hypothetical protein
MKTCLQKTYLTVQPNNHQYHLIRVTTCILQPSSKPDIANHKRPILVLARPKLQGGHKLMRGQKI